MQLRVQVLIILASALIILVVLELIRRGRLREEYSLIWLVSACVILVLAIFRGSLELLAGLVGIDYAPSMIFMVGLVMLAIIQLVQTVTISRLTMQNRDLAQLVAILQWHVRNLLEVNGLEEDVDLASVMPGAIDLRREKDLGGHEETQDTGDRPRRGDLRLVETVGGAGTASYPAQVADGGDSGRTAEHDPPYDGPGMDVIHDGQEPGQARSV
jgi:hypothetical protein